MKKVFLIFTCLCLMGMITCICFAADAPVFDPSYNSNDGAFYANGTPILIDTDANNNTVISWNGGSEVVPSTVAVFGGGREGTFYETSSITMNGGTVGALIGGGASVSEAHPARVGKSTIVVNDGTVVHSVIGGGILYATVDEANVTINGGTVAAVCGGGMASATVDGEYYSIGSEEEPENSPNRTNLTNVIINDGTINSPSTNYGLVYGGGQGYSFTGETNLEINSGDLSTAYVTAGGSNGYTGIAHVEIDGGNIYLYQSVNRGTVEETTVKVTGGTIQKFYLGGETEDASVTGTIQKVGAALLDGTIQNLSAGKSNSQPIVTDNSQYVVMKTDDIEIAEDTITSEEMEIEYQMSISETKMRLEEGETKKLEVLVSTVPEGYERLFNEVIYHCNDEEIAMVREEGFVTGIKEGTTTVTVSLLEEEAEVEIIVRSESICAWIWVTMILILIVLFLLLGVYFSYFRL